LDGVHAEKKTDAMLYNKICVFQSSSRVAAQSGGAAAGEPKPNVSIQHAGFLQKLITVKQTAKALNAKLGECQIDASCIYQG
jgi:hypothetical protein